MRRNYNSNHNIVFSCKYHVIWCPKYRRKVLQGRIAERLKSVLQSVANKYNISILEMEIMLDHVHLLLDIKPQFGIHKTIKLLKGNSSRILREEFPELRSKLPTLWTNSYFVATVGGAPLALVKQYIANQKHV